MSNPKPRVPRRTLLLVRYLEGVLTNPKSTQAMKSVAAGRLTELFLSDAQARARREIAISRAESRAELARLEKAGGSKELEDAYVRGKEEAKAQEAIDTRALTSEYLARVIRTNQEPQDAA
jgi:hypothetical protein